MARCESAQLVFLLHHPLYVCTHLSLSIEFTDLLQHLEHISLKWLQQGKDSVNGDADLQQNLQNLGPQ